MANIHTSKQNNESEKIMKDLNEILKMIEAKMDFFMIKDCLSSIGYDLSSMSMPSLKNEVECLIAHLEMENEAEGMMII